jgi:hypothetical protein
LPGIRSHLRLASHLVLAMLLLPACAPSTSPAASERHVFLIVMENHSAAEALASPFIASLAARYRVASNYSAITHPSVPNYLALTSGQTWGVSDDSYHVLPRADLGDQLTAAGVSWRAYMEGLSVQGCLGSPFPYDPGHNPFAYYGGACPPNVVPFTSLSADLDHGTPSFLWIGPDDCHNAHSCAMVVGDDWLRETVNLIQHSAAWQPSSILFITWDEDDGSTSNHVLTLVVGPGLSHQIVYRAYNHYSLLATIEDLMGVGRLGNAARAYPMSDLVSI